MRKTALWVAVVTALVLAAPIAASLTFLPSSNWQPASDYSSVKVEFGTGHGSGVHIGNGLFLTAAHVAEAGKDFTLVTRDGKKIPAKVLWIGKRHDVALLKADFVKAGATNGAPVKVASARLQCEREPEGSIVRIVGNPKSLEHVSITGRIAKLQTAVEPNWPDVQLLDISAAPGVSGGPVFDTDGNVVGLVVAGYPAAPFLGAWGLVAISVPGPVLCEMLSRHV